MSFDTTTPPQAAPADAAHAPPAPTGRHAGPWLTTEVATLRAVYPMGGAAGTQAQLPHRTLSSIRAKAAEQRVRCLRSSTEGKFLPRVYPNRPDIDNAIREGYMHATAKGDILRLAERIGRPAWWVQKRAASLGVTRTNRTRVDSWTDAELDLLERWAHVGLKVIAAKLRAIGRPRTPTAVALKLKRLKIDRTDPDRWTTSDLAPLLGVSPSTVADWAERRGLPATREGTGKTSRYLITRKALRGWINLHRQYVDLRRVDQTWFLELVFGGR